MKASRLEYSGQLTVSFHRAKPTQPGAQATIEVVGIYGDPMDIKWLQSSISNDGVNSTFGFVGFDSPQPPPGEFFFAVGHMWCRHFLKSGADVELGFVVEKFERLEAP
jgi:hypothetical protein